MNDSLEHYVRQITKLPTVPVIAREILGLVDDNKVSVERLEGIVEKDPSIAAKILSVANSSFFGFNIPTTTISNAIIRIGFNNVRNIALGISLMTVLDDGKSEHRSYYQRIFKHSAAVGVIARFISEKIKLNISEEILFNGLLHDIGFLVLNRYFTDKFSQILNELDNRASLLEAEKAVLDFGHADVGKWLGEQWNLPETVLDSMLYHHCPADAKKNVKHVAVTHLADFITSRDILSVTHNSPDYPFDNSALEILGISDDDLMYIEANISKVISSAELLK